MIKSKQLLDYAAMHPDEITIYRASDMVLAGHRNTSYLSKYGSRSTAGGNFFMKDESETPHNNGAIMTISKIIKSVMSSEVEA